MHIDKFEELVAPRILERGADYFHKGRITHLEQVEDGEFCAKIAGAEEYDVFLTVDKARHLFTHYCSCPYDFDAFCKHKVAVLLQIRAEGLLDQPPKSDSVYQAIKKELEQYSERELRQFLLDKVKKDHKFKEGLSWELGLLG